MRLCNDVKCAAPGDNGEASGGACAHDFVVELIAGPLLYCLGALQLAGKAYACEFRRKGQVLSALVSSVHALHFELIPCNCTDMSQLLTVSYCTLQHSSHLLAPLPLQSKKGGCIGRMLRSTSLHGHVHSPWLPFS
jgi:hypothetical protein